MPIYCNHDYLKIIRPLPQSTEKYIYGIPYIEVDDIDISKLNNGQWLINMKNASQKDTHASAKIVHSFSYDDVLSRAYNNPIKYLQRTAKYYAISSLDFSMHKNMTEAQIINATFMNRWFGAFAQSYGRKVVATVGWVEEDTYDICFSGLRNSGAFLISTFGVCNDSCRRTFLSGYRELRKRFPQSEIICVGNRVDGMDEDVCYVSYKNSFGNFDKYNNYWQPMLFDWKDFSGGVETCHREVL